MKDTKEPGNREESQEDRQRRLRQQRLKRERMRKRRRKALILRAVIGAAALSMVILLVSVIVAQIRKHSGKEKEKGMAAEDQIEMEAVEISNIPHLSFQSLIADPDMAFGQEDAKAAASLDQERLTVDEFNQILQKLYDNGYVLVKLEDLVEMKEDAEAEKKELLLPKGKKPLVISQQNVNYDLELTGQGLASRLVLDENNGVVCERIKSDGSAETGAFDVVPCVDEFIRQHPDFSHEGARGILGLTGYNGILGYRTDESLAVSKGNRYASKYGVFDTAQEAESVKPVLEALKAEGWELACNGYGRISYREDFEKVKEDIRLWKERVGVLTGEVKILLYPFGTDIGSWSAYGEDNEKYMYLKEQGFSYFSALEIGGPWMQIGSGYLRCNYRNLDGYRMHQDLYEQAGRFTDLFRFDSIYDRKRPSAPESGETEAGNQDGE